MSRNPQHIIKRCNVVNCNDVAVTYIGKNLCSKHRTLFNSQIEKWKEICYRYEKEL